MLLISNVDVFVIGSNAKLLSKDVITEFRGREDEIHVRPLTFKEVADFCGGYSQKPLKTNILVSLLFSEDFFENYVYLISAQTTLQDSAVGSKKDDFWDPFDAV